MSAANYAKKWEALNFTTIFKLPHIQKKGRSHATTSSSSSLVSHMKFKKGRPYNIPKPIIALIIIGYMTPSVIKALYLLLLFTKF